MNDRPGVRGLRREAGLVDDDVAHGTLDVFVDGVGVVGHAGENDGDHNGNPKTHVLVEFVVLLGLAGRVVPYYCAPAPGE